MTDLVKRLEATRTEGLAEKLKALREKATPGPWEVHALEWTAWTGNAMKDHAIRTAWIHGQLKDHAAVVGLSRRSTKDGPETGLWISPDDAALIIELVNNLDTIISALSGDGMEWRPKSDMPGWTRVTDRLPAYGEGLRVVIYTEGYDFAGEQFFHIAADALTECGFEDMPSSKDREVAARASHWIPDDELMAMIAASPALTNGKEG